MPCLLIKYHPFAIRKFALVTRGSFDGVVQSLVVSSLPVHHTLGRGTSLRNRAGPVDLNRK